MTADDVLDDAEQGARVARRTTALRVMARAGFGGSAILRALIGVLAILLALHAPGAQPDASGAFGTVARVPGGTVLLAVVALAEAALALWLVVAGVLSYSDGALERWRQRLVYWGRAAFYGVVATTAARFALGAHADSARSERRASQHLLDVPGGAVVLGLIGVVVAITGIGMLWIGASTRFRRTVHLPRGGGARAAVLTAGVVSYVARGATIAAVGGIVVVAAFTADPDRARGLTAVLEWSATTGPGRILLIAIGLGWIVSAGYAALRAFIARLA